MRRPMTMVTQEAIVPIGLLLVLGCMLVPLPPLVLDLFLCANLLFALLLVIGALHIRDPLRLATLPSLLLMATLVRLSLNLATTRGERRRAGRRGVGAIYPRRVAWKTDGD